SVTFTDQSTNGPTSWSWDFGDPATTADTSTAQNPSYVYPAAGSYPVSLTATNAFGSGSITTTVVVTSAPPPSGNLLTNGGFELADGSNHPTGWKVINGFTRSAAIPPQEGSFTGLHASTADAGWNVYQQVSVTAGQRYDFSGRVNIPATADAFKFQVKLSWRGASNTTVVVKKYTDDTAGAWQTVSATSLVAPAGATSVRIQMVPSSLNGSVYVDDFVFSRSP
ncbi:MAG: PKD domain-containing protein, partial [Candidatus Limnocylindria bacterium]